MPLMLCREFEQVTALSFHMLEGPASNHGYWQTQGSNWLNSHPDKSSDSYTRLPFLPSAVAWHGVSPSLSQPISFPASGWAEAQMSIELLCCVNDKEMQWEALNRSMWRSFFEILQVLFFKPRLCKSPSTPSVTSLPCALTPLTSSHSGSLSCSPFHAPPSVKKKCFPTIPWRCGQCFQAQGTRHPHTYFCGFSSDASPWPYGSGNKEMSK